MELNKFVNGYDENEIDKANEQARTLKGAMERLMNNPDFQTIYKHYTNQTVLEEAEKAGYAPDYRPAIFESILNRVAFKQYVKQILSLQLEEKE